MEFSEDESILEEADFASHTKHQKSDNEVEGSQQDFVYEEANEHVT